MKKNKTTTRKRRSKPFGDLYCIDSTGKKTLVIKNATDCDIEFLNYWVIEFELKRFKKALRWIEEGCAEEFGKEETWWLDGACGEVAYEFYLIVSNLLNYIGTPESLAYLNKFEKDPLVKRFVRKDKAVLNSKSGNQTLETTKEKPNEKTTKSYKGALH